MGVDLAGQVPACVLPHAFSIASGDERIGLFVSNTLILAEPSALIYLARLPAQTLQAWAAIFSPYQAGD
jgi:hypothetical protein